jgi:hypothetical protein
LRWVLSYEGFLSLRHLRTKAHLTFATLYYFRLKRLTSKTSVTTCFLINCFFTKVAVSRIPYCTTVTFSKFRGNNHKQNLKRQPMYSTCNVILRRFRVTTVAVGKQSIKHCLCVLTLVIRHANGIFSVQHNIVICSLSIYTIFALMIS